MIETIYKFNPSQEKLIEKIVDDDHVAINHMILTKGSGIPLHMSNSFVYMIIIKGTMTLKLGEQEAQKYAAGSIVHIPYETKMLVNNLDEGLLEFFVVKSPNPRFMGGQ